MRWFGWFRKKKEILEPTFTPLHDPWKSSTHTKGFIPGTAQPSKVYMTYPAVYGPNVPVPADNSGFLAGLVVAEALSQMNPKVEDTTLKPGGGDFGGAGASTTWDNSPNSITSSFDSGSGGGTGGTGGTDS